MQAPRRYRGAPMDDEAPKPPQTTKKARVHKTKGHIAVSLELDLVAKIDAVVRELSTQWHQANRSDALRMLLAKGFRAYESEKAATPKGAPDPAT